MSTLALPPASVTVYVRVIISGHVLPSLTSLLDTTKAPSAVHASAIIKSPVKSSNTATVVSAAGAAQPSTGEAVIEPVTAGAVVSSTVIV